MADKNKKRPLNARSVKLHDEKNADSYDVKSARHKIEGYMSRSRKKVTSGQTSTKTFEDGKRADAVSRNYIEDRTSYTSASEYQIDNFSRLDNRLTNYETHNNEAHDCLRKELEEKINRAKEDNANEIEKVENRCIGYVNGKTKESKLFALVKWILPIVVTVCIAWFANSYIKIVDKVDGHENRLIKLESIGKSLEDEQKVDTLNAGIVKCSQK